MAHQIAELRQAAWGPVIGAQAAAARFGLEPADLRAYHIVVEDSSGVAAGARLVIAEDVGEVPDVSGYESYFDRMHFPVGVGSRLVVRPDCRRLGFAGRLIGARLELARRVGLHEVWGETRMDRAPGLVEFGYALQGPSGDTSVPGDWGIFRVTLVGPGTAP